MKKYFLLLVTLLLGFSLAQNVVFSPQSIVVNPIPSFDVQVSVDRDPSGNERPSYTIGDSIRIAVRPSEDAYVYLYNVHSDGTIVQILPNALDADGQNNFVRGGETKVFPAAGARYTFNIQGPVGIDKVIAVASKKQLDTSSLAQFTGGNFAESTSGEESFAQTLSIIVQPIPQTEWVTDTALFYIVQANTPPPQPQFGTLLLTTSPSGARALVDGQFVGYTPVRFGTNRGSHDVRFELDGYQAASQSVNLPGGQTVTVNSNLTAIPRNGIIRIQSTPVGASAYISGTYYGVTPLRVDLPAGTYEVEIQANNYESFRRTVNLSGGQNVEINASLVAIPQTGFITVNSTPSGGRVFIDGLQLGQTPLRYEAQAGRHEIRVELGGYGVFRSTVDLLTGQDVRVDANLRPLAGSLSIISNVGGATAFINGRRVDTLLNSNGRLTVPDLPAGTHELTLVRDGYRTVVRDFEIVGGETTTLSVTQNQ